MIVVHGDDFTVLGGRKGLDWFRERIQEKFPVKFRGRLGPTDKDDKEIRILNRIITWTDEGILYEADQRHAEIIIMEMNLKSNSVFVSFVQWSFFVVFSRKSFEIFWFDLAFSLVFQMKSAFFHCCSKRRDLIKTVVQKSKKV